MPRWATQFVAVAVLTSAAAPSMAEAAVTYTVDAGHAPGSDPAMVAALK